MKRALTIAGLGLLTGVALSLVTPGMAQARDGGPRMERSFSDLDVDGDGQITEADFTARQTARFAGADTDADGAVTPEEMVAAIVSQMSERFAASETGRTPSEEKRAERAERRAEWMFSRLDADNNGTLEADEFQPRRDVSRLIDRFDTDDDNAWSEAEFDAMQSERHARMDHRGKGGGKGEGRGGHGDRGERGGRW